MNIPAYIRPYLNRLHQSGRSDPSRGWFILLSLSGIALVGIIVWNILAFETVARGGTIGAPTDKTSFSVLDHAQLDSVRMLLVKRAAEEAKYVTGEYHFTDPSQ
ncbi:hypothetical protein A3G63_02275 [Candidatus Kaiserbacteria bacterium RIFCSPLOWO2_12_FULL_52_8]|nr:MAG: hypothetical protein A3G63_02275 [Candidatus Kaiserbacteria bacterium RIFCSPLOWO2_12_FULL_52_8]